MGTTWQGKLARRGDRWHARLLAEQEGRTQRRTVDLDTGDRAEAETKLEALLRAGAEPATGGDDGTQANG